MTDNKFIEIPKTYEQYTIPTVEEIRDKQAKLPAEYIKNLKDFQMKFNKKVFAYCSSCSGSNRNITFELKIILQNCVGDKKRMTVYNTNRAHEEARKIKAESGGWEDGFLSFFSQEDRRKLADKINDRINSHKQGKIIDTSVCNKDDSGRVNDDEYLARHEDMQYWMYGPGSYSGYGNHGGHRGGFIDG